MADDVAITSVTEVEARRSARLGGGVWVWDVRGGGSSRRLLATSVDVEAEIQTQQAAAVLGGLTQASLAKEMQVSAVSIPNNPESVCLVSRV